MNALHTIFLQASPYESNSGPSPFFIFFALAIIVFILILAFKKKVGEIHSNEVFSFVDVQFSTEDYYKNLIVLIQARQMPDVQINTINYPEGGFGQGLRLYLRVCRKDDIFDICAAPFGCGSFVSYWHGEPKKRLKELASQIPRVNTVVNALDNKTRFELDTAAVFRTWVKECIDEAIKQITAQGVIRQSPLEMANIKD